jgi:hypothetical protein
MPSLIETFDALASLDNALRTTATTARALTLAKPKPKPRAPRTHPYSRHELDSLIDRLEERTRGM